MVSTHNSRTVQFTQTIDLAKWMEHICTKCTPQEREQISRACHLANQVHENQLHSSGNLRLVHVIHVADILLGLGMDIDVLIAAILHETMVDTTFITADYIEQHFGSTVSKLVSGVNKMRLIEEINDEMVKRPDKDSVRQNEALRKMLLAMAEDVRVILIKLADRLDKMRTLQRVPEDKCKRIARQTLDIFVPLANRLGIGQIKWELEDLSLRYLEPETYQQIARFLDERRINREHFIQKIVNVIGESLQHLGLTAEVTGRPKHIYSIWRKMQRKGLNFEQIYDVRAVRVLVNTLEQCYLTLGTVHHHWKPIPSEFDDYIANPKINGYQSLHTAVLGPDQKIFEVQIRTHQMHHQAELGVAAHWRYKEEHAHQDKSLDQVAWLRQLLKKEDGNEYNNFIDQFKSDMVDEHVYVMTPRGKIIDLPYGSTPLDFAYAIHTDLGHRCRGAKVNGKIVPLTYHLKTGTQVEILLTQEPRPSRDWINPNFHYLKTVRAINKVKQWLKRQDTQQHLIEGRALLERELRRLNVLDISQEDVAKHLGFSSLINCLASIGSGDTTMTEIAQVLEAKLFPKNESFKPILTERKMNGQSHLHLKGVGDTVVNIARCCHPVPNDPIIAYLTKARGVVVHRGDCSHAQRWQSAEHERLLEVEWAAASEPQVYPINILVEAFDRTGLLKDVTSSIHSEKVNIIASNSSTNKNNNNVMMQFTIEVIDSQQLSRVLARVDEVHNVLGVARKN
jgi:GTP pyrophosphokinase